MKLLGKFVSLVGHGRYFRQHRFLVAVHCPKAFSCFVDRKLAEVVFFAKWQRSEVIPLFVLLGYAMVDLHRPIPAGHTGEGRDKGQVFAFSGGHFSSSGVS